ncbi:MAG: SDR family oxidoreductase [Oscillochloris sp.]|nr:SDR family oxidoreductase [Oscillochloris sp.]
MAKQQISLSGKVAVITGSTRGIGRAVAERYGRAGARVIVSSQDAEAVTQTVLDLRAKGVVCEGIMCDISDLSQVHELVRRAVNAFGQIDIWVNNAGVAGVFGPVLDIAPEEWRRVIEVNLLGTYNCCISVLPHMIERRSGKIINFSGGGAQRAQRYLSAYSTSKAAIVRMNEAFVRDYSTYPGISFNVLTPGMVPTDMMNSMRTVGAGVEAIQDLPRIMRIFSTTTEETAELALRMASSETDGVSGKIFEVMPRRRFLWRLAAAAVRGRMN